MAFVEELEKLKPCRTALIWAKDYDSLQSAWDACPNGSWMLWLIGKKAAGKVGSSERRKLVLCAVDCARTAWQWMPDEGKRALELTERYGNGDESVTLDMLRAAAVAASYAAYAASVVFAAHTSHAATLKVCSDIVRKHYPSPPELYMKG